MAHSNPLPLPDPWLMKYWGVSPVALIHALTVNDWPIAGGTEWRIGQLPAREK
jgi:hypothetical protein